MKKFINFLILSFFIYTILQILNNSNLFINSVNNSILIWKNNVFPSIFPFIIISDFLINYGFLNVINYLFGYFFKIFFNVNSNVAYVFFISLISGFPSSAITINDLYNKKLLSLESSNKAILFCHFSNPLFIFNFIGNSLGLDIAIKILFIHYLSSIIIGLFVRNMNNGLSFKSKNICNKFGTVLKKSINKGFDNLFIILGTIIFFNIILEAVNLTNLPICIKYFINIFLELTNGINFILTNINSIKIKCILITMLLSFGGLCIHLQVFSILEDTKIKYRNYFLARFFQAILSGILSILIC